MVWISGAVRPFPPDTFHFAPDSLECRAFALREHPIRCRRRSLKSLPVWRPTFSRQSENNLHSAFRSRTAQLELRNEELRHRRPRQAKVRQSFDNICLKIEIQSINSWTWSGWTEPIDQSINQLVASTFSHRYQLLVFHVHQNLKGFVQVVVRECVRCVAQHHTVGIFSHNSIEFGLQFWMGKSQVVRLDWIDCESSIRPGEMSKWGLRLFSSKYFRQTSPGEMINFSSNGNPIEFNFCANDRRVRSVSLVKNTNRTASLWINRLTASIEPAMGRLIPDFDWKTI